MTKFQIFKYSAIVLLGCAVSLIVFFVINNRSQVRNRTIIDTAISKSLLKINDELNKVNLVIESMGFFFENKDDVSQEVFERFTNPFLKELGVGALEWAPKIEDSLLAKYKGFPEITERDAKGNLVKSKKKEFYYPITLLHPLEPLKNAIGYDNYSENTRKLAIDSAVVTRKIAITGPIQLIQKDNGVPGFLAIKAVYSSAPEKIKGIIAGIYRMDLFIGKTLSSETNVLDICIHDDVADQELLYSSFGDTTIENFEKNAISRKIMAANRQWQLHFIPKPEYLAFPNLFESYVVLFFGLLSTCILALAIRRRDNYNDRLEARVLLRTSELEASNTLKENLLREIHHRVKNNLQITSSLMNMQKRKLTSKEAITALQDSQARISAIALTHQKIYQDKDSKAVNLHEYLKDLMEYQKKISPSFSYKIECPEISIDLDRAVPLALIISELVTNAVKHAYPDTTKYNELLINVKRLKGDEVSLDILDNGKGLPEDFDIDNAEGIGFEIIRALCRQISAKLSYESTDYGTKFNLLFENKT